MTRGSETAAVLMRALDLLDRLASPTHHALLPADERKSALQQLMLTTEAATKLAEVARLDALTAQRAAYGDAVVIDEAATVSVKEETTASAPEGIVVSAQEESEASAQEETEALWRAVEGDAQWWVRDVDGVEVVVKKMEGLAAELKRARSRELQAEANLKRCRAVKAGLTCGAGVLMQKGVRGMLTPYGRALVDMEKARVEVDSAQESVKRIASDTGARMLALERDGIEKLEAEVERAGQNLEGSLQETERLRVEMDRVESKKAEIEGKMLRLRVEVGKLMLNERESGW